MKIMGAKIGLQQISKPTPSIVNLAVRIINIICSSIIAWLPTSVIIPEKVQPYISSPLGLLLILVNASAPLFGVDIKSGTVPTKDVTAVNTEVIKLIVFAVLTNLFLYSL